MKFRMLPRSLSVAASAGLIVGALWMSACNGQIEDSDVPATPSACREPNPADPSGRCRSNDECGEGEACITVPDQCVPSACSCDEEDGTWTCTADCGELKSCQAASCEGDDPSARACSGDEECSDGERCLPSTQRECVPSACGCDAATGTWTCTADCSPTLCQASSACEGDPPSKDGCTTDEDCPGVQTCQVSPIDACRPSSCECLEDTGEWGCSKDCLPYHACGDK